MEKAEKHLHVLSLELMRTGSLGWLTRRNDTAVSCTKGLWHSSCSQELSERKSQTRQEPLES